MQEKQRRNWISWTNNVYCNEQLSLTTAAKLGISVPESFIINTGSAKDEEIRIFGILRNHVTNPMEDQLKLWDRMGRNGL